ncbi:hypothetical protein [Bradyrhizobium genosp. A]|uniref:hypothetical protein n=1 Tax=Bradyrhizobium genosp. A TaxID=83626 RepID=UPI003CF48E41
MLEVTEFETKRIASAAAKEALQDFMLMLGVDISTPAGILDLQKDFHHVRQSRFTVGNVRNKAWDVLTGSAVTGIIGAVAFYLTHAMGK